MIVRTVNYSIRADGSYKIPPPGIVQTRNFLVMLGAGMLPLPGTRPVELANPKPQNMKCTIVGLEDLRIVDISDTEITCTGTRLDASPTGSPEIWRFTWSPTTGRIIDYDADIAPRRLSAQGRTPEKNWLPFGWQILYGHTPITILDADGENPVTLPTPGLDLSGFRGGAAPIPYRDGLLYVIHEVVHPTKPGTRRVYLHRFCHAPDGDFSRLRISIPFTFMADPGIEFCAGIAAAIDDPENAVVLSYGREDASAWTCRTSVETVEKLLNACAS
jgi:hypothetical protein